MNNSPTIIACALTFAAAVTLAAQAPAVSKGVMFPRLSETELRD